MFGRIFNFNRLECPGSNVKKHVSPPHSLLDQRFEQPRSEMQSSGWRGDRSRLLGVNCLIPFFVSRDVWARDVRRKRNVTVTLYRLFRGQRRTKKHYASAPLGRLENLNLEIRTHMDNASRLELSTGMNHRFVPIIAKRFEKQQFRRRTGVTCAEQTCMKHASGVEHDRVARRNQIDQIAKRSMLDCSGCTIYHHQSAFITLAGWNLCYLVGRKMKVVMIGSATVSDQKSEGCGDPPDGIVNPK